MGARVKRLLRDVAIGVALAGVIYGAIRLFPGLERPLLLVICLVSAGLDLVKVVEIIRSSLTRMDDPITGTRTYELDLTRSLGNLVGRLVTLILSVALVYLVW